MLRGKNHWCCRRNRGALDERGLVRLVHDLRTSVVRNGNLTDVPAVFLQQRDDGVLVFRACLDGDLGAANTDRGNRRVYGHRVGTRLCNLAGNKRENTLDHREGRGAFTRLGVKDHFVQHHPRALIERKFGVVDKGQADGTFVVRLQDVALENGVALVEFNTRSVSSDRENAAFGGIHGTDGLIALPHQGCVALATTEEIGARKRLCNVGHDLAAALGHENRRHLATEEVLHDDLLASLAGQLKLATGPRKIGVQQHRAVRHRQCFDPSGI